jgi:hypothetical protein
MEEEFLRFEEDKAMGCGNLSSTLQKLYMWEKKLLEEVKGNIGLHSNDCCHHVFPPQESISSVFIPYWLYAFGF